MGLFTYGCPCGYTGQILAGDPCPKCGAVHSCYSCYESFEAENELAFMVMVTDPGGTGPRGFCADCKDDLERLREDLIPVYVDPAVMRRDVDPEPNLGSLVEDVEAFLRRSQGRDGGAEI